MNYYTLFYKKPNGMGTSKVFTNLMRLAVYTGYEQGEAESDSESLNYYTLVHHFTRKKKTWYEDPYKGVIVIRSFDMERGRMRFKKGPAVHNRNI